MEPMLAYLGVKLVAARRMTRGEYNAYRGWVMPSDENPADDGYFVRYPDGYESWCPLKQFEEANRRVNNLPFGHALEAAKMGKKIARAGWDGKGQFVVMMMPGMYLSPYNTQGTERKVNDRTAKWIWEDKPLDSQPYFVLFNAQGKWQPGWVPSTGDLFAEDWMTVE